MTDCRTQPQTVDRADVRDDIDYLLDDSPGDLKRIQENRAFIRKAKTKPIPEEDAKVKVFGVKSVNLNAILKKNIEGRNITTVDHLCKMYLDMTIEQRQKYQRRRRKVPFNLLFILLLAIGAAVGLMILLFFLGGI